MRCCEAEGSHQHPELLDLNAEPETRREASAASEQPLSAGRPGTLQHWLLKHSAVGPAPNSYLLTGCKGRGGHVTVRAFRWSEQSDHGFSTAASAAAFQVQPWPAGILPLPSDIAPRTEPL